MILPSMNQESDLKPLPLLFEPLGLYLGTSNNEKKMKESIQHKYVPKRFSNASNIKPKFQPIHEDKPCSSDTIIVDIQQSPISVPQSSSPEPWIEQWMQQLQKIDEQLHDFQFSLAHYCKEITNSIIQRFYEVLDPQIKVDKISQLVELVCEKLIIPHPIHVYAHEELLPLLEKKIKTADVFDNFNISLRPVCGQSECRIEWGESSLVWSLKDFLQQVQPLIDEYLPIVMHRP